jgi:hypothetical protein
MFKQLVEAEEWYRLPLPENFEIKELEEPMKDLPIRFDKYI